MGSLKLASKEVVRVWSTELYEPTYIELGGSGMDEEYGVPFRSQEAIRHALKVIIGQMGLELDAVLFSGYNVEAAHQGADFNSLKPELIELTDEIIRLQDEGVFDRQPELRSTYQQRLNAIRGSGNLKSYSFSDFEGLSEPPEESSNPIHYAGTNEGAVISVYDNISLGALNQDEDSPIHTIVAARGLIESAKILEFYPRFKV